MILDYWLETHCTGIALLHSHIPNAYTASFLGWGSGHKDSVTCAGFCHDSKLVASGDMNGLIKVWKIETKEEIWSFEVGDLEVN